MTSGLLKRICIASHLIEIEILSSIDYFSTLTRRVCQVLLSRQDSKPRDFLHLHSQILH